MLAKPLGPGPHTCSGCPLETRGAGFSPASSNPKGKIFFLAEALGAEEAYRGDNLVGPAGQFFDRLLWKNSISREAAKISNCIKCRPPENALVGASYEFAALEHCRRAYLDKDIEEWLRGSNGEHDRVMVTLGGVALKQIMRLVPEQAKLENWHGTVSRDPSGRFWVVPTYHPSHLQRGGWNLTGVASFDLQRAKEVVEEGWAPDPMRLHLDPPVEWFRAWANQYIAACRRDPVGTWLAVDTETADKIGRDEGELTAKDQSYHIIRYNFSCNPDEGITVPAQEPYLSIIKKVLETLGPKLFWHWLYDVRRIWAAGYKVLGPIWDMMWAWHMIQSDVPRGLGFVASFFSRYGPWKHLAYSQPVKYAAIDGPQTLRCAYGIVPQLVENGQWESFLRHQVKLEQEILIPSTDIGLLVDKEAIEKFGAELSVKRETIFNRIQGLVDRSLWPLDPKEGLRKAPELQQDKEEDIVWRPLEIIKKEEVKLVKVCRSCGAVEIAKTHRCEDRSLKPELALEERQVVRFYRQLPFNPNSWQQVLRLIYHLGLKPGKNKKDKSKDTTDKETLERLMPKHQAFGQLLLFRQVAKVKGTYVDGTTRRLAAQETRGVCDGRLHATYTDKPSSWRKSMVAPNLQNVIGDKSGKEALAAGFRRCIIAAPGALLMEADAASIEAVTTGWCIWALGGEKASENARTFIRLARLGIHAYVASHELKRPADLSWSDKDLGAYFKEIKAADVPTYERCKRGVYQTLYKGSPAGLVAVYPKHFKDQKDAARFQKLVYEVCPGLEEWHWQTMTLAARQNYLGGQAHPWKYKHWYWKVFDYRRLKRPTPVDGWRVVQFDDGKVYSRSLSEDGKRAIAYGPQSIAAGHLKETTLRLHDEENPNYVGDMWYGRTPLRALIHDANLGEYPEGKVEEAIRKVVLETCRPVKELPIPESWGWGPYLSIGVEVKVGRNWLAVDKEDNQEGMKKIDVTALQAEGQGLPAYEGVAWDDTIDVDMEEGDEEDEFAEIA